MILLLKNFDFVACLGNFRVSRVSVLEFFFFLYLHWYCLEGEIDGSHACNWNNCS